MIKRALPALLGILSCCLPAIAQQPVDPAREIFTVDELRQTGELETAAALTLYRQDLIGIGHGSVLIHDLPALTLLDGRRFAIQSELGRMGRSPLDVIPLAFLSAVEVDKVGSTLRYGSDGPGGVVNLRLKQIQTGGEVGMFYGRSDGKYAREDMQAHVIGGVSTDKFQVTAGAAYQETNARSPRPSR